MAGEGEQKPHSAKAYASRRSKELSLATEYKRMNERRGSFPPNGTVKQHIGYAICRLDGVLRSKCKEYQKC